MRWGSIFGALGTMTVLASSALAAGGSETHPASSSGANAATPPGLPQLVVDDSGSEFVSADDNDVKQDLVRMKYHVGRELPLWLYLAPTDGETNMLSLPYDAATEFELYRRGQVQWEPDELFFDYDPRRDRLEAKLIDPYLEARRKLYTVITDADKIPETPRPSSIARGFGRIEVSEDIYMQVQHIRKDFVNILTICRLAAAELVDSRYWRIEDVPEKRQALATAVRSFVQAKRELLKAYVDGMQKILTDYKAKYPDEIVFARGDVYYHEGMISQWLDMIHSVAEKMEDKLVDNEETQAIAYFKI